MEQIFRPPRQRGFTLHFGALLLNLSAIGYLILLALSQSTRGFFILYIIASIVIFIPAPVIAFRLLALLRAKYTVSREGITIQWGLRAEEIPMSDIEWVRMADDLAVSLPLPHFSVEGAVAGIRNHRDLGPIEFLASRRKNPVLVATRKKIFAITPRDNRSFITAFNRSAELGSIAPSTPKSTRGEFLIGALFKDRYARFFILGGIILSLGLLTAVSFIIPTRETIPLGFNPVGQASESSTSDRLLLLPLLSLLMLTADLAVGSYLYRKTGYRMAAYFAYASSMIMPLSFLGILISLR